MKTHTLHIGGMTCVNCQNRIEKKLKSTPGVENAAVDFRAGTVAVTYDETAADLSGIKAAVESLGYQALDEKARAPAREIAGTLVIILALYVLLRGLGLGALTSAFPLAETGMGYGMLLVMGLITSLHCAAMCGGINLSQCLSPGSGQESADRKPLTGRRALPAPLLPSILYNGGRVISYTIVGIIAGALGSVITLPGRFQGIVQLAAGGFMILMGINMLGLFPALRRFTPRLPRLSAKKAPGQKTLRKSPLIVGLLNGLMPCGPLQAMQLYALSTGSPVTGGISMFLFSMGTVPLMFGVGALGSLLSGSLGGDKGRAFSRRVMKAGAMLVTVMGLFMLSYGAGLSGFSIDIADKALAGMNPFAGAGGRGPAAGQDGAFTPVIENGVQIVNSALSGGRYPAITVQQGIPVRWTINAPTGSINGCNNRMIIREYGIEHRFSPGDNVIEFTPERTGRFSYSCWMGMIRSSITVVAEGASIADIPEPNRAPSPAGVAVPTEDIVIAELERLPAEGNGGSMPGARSPRGVFQTVSIQLLDEGIAPAVMVVQRGIPAVWTIRSDSLDPGNSRLIVPAYYSQLDIQQGENIFQFMPVDDFDFSTADNVFYGYVKVVDDINAVDLEAVRAEVSAHETLIYPEAYFEAQASGGGCCG